MFDRGVLFVGSGGIGLGVLAEAMAHDWLRRRTMAQPLRVYSGTTHESARIDPVLVRALDRMNLDSKGLSSKPLALFAFTGAPRIDHLIALDATVPAATRLALGEAVDIRHWPMAAQAQTLKNAEPGNPPGLRFQAYTALGAALRPKVDALMAELTDLTGIKANPVAHTG